MPVQHVMTRRRFLGLTDDLIGEGEALLADPDWNRFRLWLLNSDELLEKVWGRMDRYHLAWLNVGRDSAPPARISILSLSTVRTRLIDVSSADRNSRATHRQTG